MNDYNIYAQRAMQIQQQNALQSLMGYGALGCTSSTVIGTGQTKKPDDTEASQDKKTKLLLLTK